ncbi:MAG: alpha-L-fucosidase [Clostridia bacterium]|nr:alpha-L-fucosidase [Clostridia bacterium]
MSSYLRKKTPGDTSWFVHDRFGMFIHWGLYSMPARHEWVRYHEQITNEEYEKYFLRFDPDLYDPHEWARAAKNAGMKYAVLTTKHHEGFCMFDSQYTDYKCTNTPAGRDLVKEYVEAFRAEGLKVGFYYSLIDWHHPEFPIDMKSPVRNWPREKVEAINQKRDMRKYAEYMRNQVTELLTNYGKIDILWFDYSYSGDVDEKSWLHGKGKDDWEAEKLIATARALQPDIIIDNRTEIDQDLWTPEQVQPTDWVRHPVTGEYVTWEACQTFSGSWGYHRDEMTWKSPEMLIQMLIQTVSCGGNMLLNVGPTSRGYFDERATSALSAMGDWMHYNSRSIYGCTMAEPDILKTCPNGCRYTQTEDGKRLYVHLFSYPFHSLQIPGLAGKVAYAQFLHDGSEIRFYETDPTPGTKAFEDGTKVLNLMLPPVKPRVIVPVIELFLKD